MNDLADIIDATTSRILTEHLDGAQRRDVEGGGNADDLWAALNEAGLFDALSGGLERGRFAGLDDACTVLRCSGRHAITAPMAEAMVARWMGSAAGLEPDKGRVAMLPATLGNAFTARRQDDALLISGHDGRVPWLAASRTAMVIAESGSSTVAAVVSIDEAKHEDRRSIANEPLSAISLDSAPALRWKNIPPSAGIVCEDGLRMLALLRSVMMVGAAERIVEITVSYAEERQQFGRPIGKFQAVQQNLALLAAETAACAAILDAAVFEIVRRDRWSPLVDAACARIRLMSDEIARIAHQVHGAIGFTQEYVLHNLTRRLLAWRDDYGHARYWSAALAGQVLSVDARSLWPLVTSM